ncbi:MAG TPA: 8-amino-7-oxononanoate synthase [Candidatus Angelobacter sp.]|nr:8-amino-7-oxononanoate synthase [Candidatus Angelobacter sp.]
MPIPKPSHDPLDRMAARLADLERHDRLRSVYVASGVDLCSNDYLGLSRHPLLKGALQDAVGQMTRVSSTGSRLLSGHHPIWDELEDEFAAFAGTEAALYFGSGFAANLGLLSSVLNVDDVVFSDALNHASLIDGTRLARCRKVIYPHCDLDFLEDELKRCAHSDGSGAKLIVTESIFSMDGDRAPLRELFQLGERYGARLIVDEAHATATCGWQGRGLTADFGLQNQALAVVHTCGKALAGAGAFVCGSKILKQFLVNHARSFIFSTGMPPYFGLQIRAALRLAAGMDAERDYLAALSAKLRDSLRSEGFDCGQSNSHIVPLIVQGNGEVVHLAEILRERGFAVKAIRSPSVPPGRERLRLSCTADVSAEEIERFVDIVSKERVALGA